MSLEDEIVKAQINYKNINNSELDSQNLGFHDVMESELWKLYLDNKISEQLYEFLKMILKRL